MGLYEEYVLPRCIDLVCGSSRLGEERRSALHGLSGSVLELGFGSGTNIPYYPRGVTEVLAVEPSALAVRLARTRIAEGGIPVRYVALRDGRIDLPDASVDSAVSTFTLCTVPDAQSTLRELRRVLRPHGKLHFLEHGLAPDAGVQRAQRWLNTPWRALAGGCQLTRDLIHDVERAGLVCTEQHAHYFEPVPRTHGYLVRGVAVKPDDH